MYRGSWGNIHPMLVQCWSSVADGGPAMRQHWANVSCFLVYKAGWRQTTDKISKYVDLSVIWENTAVQWIKCEPLGKHLIHLTCAVFSNIARKVSNVCIFSGGTHDILANTNIKPMWFYCSATIYNVQATSAQFLVFGGVIAFQNTSRMWYVLIQTNVTEVNRYGCLYLLQDKNTLTK